jgi:hypothetical protein
MLLGLARHPAVGQQHLAVVHLDGKIRLAHHVEGLGARQAHPPGQQLAGNAHSKILGGA